MNNLSINKTSRDYQIIKDNRRRKTLWGVSAPMIIILTFFIFTNREPQDTTVITPQTIPTTTTSIVNSNPITTLESPTTTIREIFREEDFMGPDGSSTTTTETTETETDETTTTTITSSTTTSTTTTQAPTTTTITTIAPTTPTPTPTPTTTTQAPTITTTTTITPTTRPPTTAPPLPSSTFVKEGFGFTTFIFPDADSGQLTIRPFANDAPISITLNNQTVILQPDGEINFTVNAGDVPILIDHNAGWGIIIVQN